MDRTRTGWEAAAGRALNQGAAAAVNAAPKTFGLDEADEALALVRRDSGGTPVALMV